MAEGLIIRPARPEDLPAVERICAHTFEWGDYVPEAWEDWLADERGMLLAGEMDGRVVAVNKITFLSPGEVWLEGMRVDPAFRRRGISWRFHEHNMAVARERGARVVRLATGDSNTAVHAMMEKAGLERVGVAALLQAPARPEAPLPAVLKPGHAARVAAFLAASPVLAHTHGLYDCGWAWRELSSEHAAELLAAGQIVAWPPAGGELLALATAQPDPKDESVWVGYADGRPEDVTALAVALRGHAARLGAQRVEAMLPDLAWLHDAFRAAGYEPAWDGQMWVFEKRLDDFGF